MYHKKFVTCIKVNGKVLRENDGEVAIPFGSEYSILLKNMNSVRAQARATIDGEDASGWLILQPKGELDLKRFIKNNNLDKGNKFKFIERTSKIENHRGIGVEDGLISVEYKFEKRYTAPQYPITIIHEHHNWPWYNYINLNSWPYSNITYGYPTITTTTTSTNAIGGPLQGTCNNVDSYSMNCNMETSDQNISCGPFMKSSCETPVKSRSVNVNNLHVASMQAISENKSGITVAGGESNQKFHNVSDFVCEETEVMVLKLVGCIGKIKIENPITVDIKPTCTTCGRKNKATNKFCAECGTALHII